MRFHYDPSRPKFDVVTGIELGEIDKGYRAIDISGNDERPTAIPRERPTERGAPFCRAFRQSCSSP
jgi:hypothetical protein